jgi:phosphotransferase system  glucose/maltose/N-acetylglucosamine-specific IIC component
MRAAANRGTADGRDDNYSLCNLGAFIMVFLKAAGIGGSILAILALVIYLLKTLISLIAFLTGALKILVVLVFVAVIVGIGFMVLKGWNEARRNRD